MNHRTGIGTHLFWQSLHQDIKADLVNKRLGQSSRKDVLSRSHVFVQIGDLEVGLELVEGRRQLVRDDCSRLGRLVSVVLFGDTAK